MIRFALGRLAAAVAASLTMLTPALAGQKPSIYQSDDGTLYSNGVVMEAKPGVPIGGGVFSTGTDFPVVIATNGTPVQLPAHTLVNGLTCRVVAPSGGLVAVSFSATPSNPQTTSFGAGAVGIYLSDGSAWAWSVNNSNALYLNGTAGDGLQCTGN